MRRATLYVFAALVAAHEGFAADLLILRDGTRHPGALAACVGEQCVLSGETVAYETIAWIGLGVGEDTPPTGVRERGAVLADGSVRPGRLLGMSTATVLLETEELDRALVHWVRVAEVPPPVDVFVRRDGALRTGELEGCAAESCTMSGEATTRVDLAWIGLGVDPEAIVNPAAPQDPARDMAQLADGSLVVTPLVGVGANDVVLGIGAYARTEISWIYLAPPAAERGPPVVYEPSPPPPPPGEDPPRPPGEEPPRPLGEEPPRAPDSPAAPGSAYCDPQLGLVRGSGVMWTGTARMRQSIRGPGYFEEDTADFDVKLRESCESPVLDRSVTPHRRIGTIVYLDSEGTVQRDNHRGDLAGCLCGGDRTHTSPPGSGGQIWRRTGPGDTSGSVGFDLPSQPIYSLGIGSNDGEILESPCRGQYCDGSIASRSLLEINAGRLPDVPPETNWDPEMRSPEGGILRGSWTKPVGPATYQASWSVCRAGVSCPPPPEVSGGGAPPPPSPPPEEDSCGDLTAARAQVDVLWNQRQAFAGEMEAEWNSLEQAHSGMLDNVEAYRAAIGACAIWDIVSETLESASGWAGEFTEFGTKVLSGDLSAFVGEEPWKSLSERAWDAFPRQSTWAGNMHDRITGCNAPIPPELRTAALRFVDSWERVRGLMPAVQQQLNRIRDWDLRYWNEWHRFYRTCQQWAACKGTSPADCPQPPEQPSGPMPPAPPG